MGPIDFLKTVWPAQGLYCIAIPEGKGFAHKIFETIDAAAAYVDRLGSTKNVFFATHTLIEARVWNANKKPAAGWSYRTQKNMRCSRVLFFDLDVKPDAYPTQGEAITALKKFVGDNKLPQPMVVNSGSGVHVYWVLEEDLRSKDEWFTQASRLKQLARHCGLKFDPSRTTDSASVLRVAGSFNLKKDKALPVYVVRPAPVIPVATWSRALLAAIDDADLTAVAERHAPDDADDGLGSNTKIEFEGPGGAPPPMTAVLKACGQMRRIATAYGKVSEPDWYWGCVGVGKHTKEGVTAVHRLSKGHPTYSVAETEAKIAQWGSKGPAMCSSIEEHSEHSDICQECKFYKQNSSPIPLARLVDTAPPVVITNVDTEINGPSFVVPDPPQPYIRTGDKQIAIITENKSGKEQRHIIHPYDLYPISRSNNAQNETEQQTWRVHKPHSEATDFTIEASAFVDPKALETRLANHGVYSREFPELRKYMSAYIQELQTKYPVTEQHNQLGWIGDHSKFVMPTKTFSAGLVSSTALSKQAVGVKDYVSKKGTLEKQIELMHFYDDPAYVANQFYVLSSLGAALFYMTGHHGVIVHATGEPGASKSTALYTAASMWGPPMQYVLNGTSDGATALYRNARRDLLANLPLCIDEITHIADDVAKTFAMNATQVGPRGRLKNDGTPSTTTTNERSTMVLTTANRSLHAALAADNAAGTAGSVRVFEIVFRKRGVHKPHEADDFLRGIKEHYGHIGEQFIRFVVDNQEKVTARVIKVMEVLGKKAGVKEEERFWFAGAAASLVAGSIMRSLGYITWDLGKIENWLLTDQLPEMRGTVSEEAYAASPVTTITSYLEAINGDMIKTRAPTAGSNLPDVVQIPRGAMVAHYETDTRAIYVLKDHFKGWCERRGQYAQGILKELHVAGIVPNMNVRHVMGDGSPLHGKGKSSCFLVNMNHPAVSATVHLQVIQGGLAGGNIP